MKRYTEITKYEPVVIGKACLEIDLTPKWVALPFLTSPIWKRIFETFTPENYLYVAPPIQLGHFKFDLKELRDLRVLRCPIKKAGENKVWLPKELEPLFPIVRHVLETELHINPKFKHYFSHISFELTKVSKGKTQRVPGWHMDGYQGKRAPYHTIEHSYLWSDSVGTEYCLQPFFINHLDPARHNVFDEICKQAKEENAYASLSNCVYLIDPYLVHRSPVVTESGYRSFLRITFTETELEDPANTVNLSLKGNGYAPRIDVRDRLFPYEGEVPIHLYGIKKKK